VVEHQYLGEAQGWRGKPSLHHITCAAVSGTWWGGPTDERGIPVADQRDGVPNGYHVFTFSGNQYQERFKAAGKEKSYQMRIIYPKGVIKQNELADSLIIVNVFNGSEKSLVEYRIDVGDYKTLAREIRRDLYFVALHARHNDTYPDWVEPRESNHMWIGKLPAELETGVHTLEVRTVDQYGKKYQATSILEISD